MHGSTGGRWKRTRTDPRRGQRSAGNYAGEDPAPTGRHRPAPAPYPTAASAAADNAAMESFFALLQNNVLNRQSWATRDELRLAIITWIERTYHRRRRQRALGKLTPIEFEAVIAYNRVTEAA